MIRLFLIWTLAIWGGSASAQTLPVRTGEHGDFTRLVIDIARGTPWTLAAGTDPFDQIIRFPGNRFSFDTGDVFARLNTQRLENVGAVPGTGDLGLKLGCDCQVDAFVLNGTMLVVDISPKPDSQNPAAQNPDARPRTPFPQGGIGANPWVVENPDPPVQTFGALPLEKLATWSSQSWSTDAPVGDNGVTPATGANQDALGALERDISQQLARAVTTGLLHVSPALSNDDLARKSDPPLSQDAGVSRTPDVAAPLRQDNPRARVEDGRILLSGDHCVPDADLALADWAGDAPFDVQLRDLRQGLVGEFDRTDSEVAEKLARFYLHYGFGPEAKSLLALSDDPAATPLLSLASLLDGKRDPHNTFSGQSHCDGLAAMWSVLAMEGTRPDRSVNTRAVLRSFELLPDTLKTYLAEPLVDQLMFLGEKTAAQDLLTRVGRAQASPSPGIELARARMDIDAGHVAAASDRLTEVARNGPPGASADAVETLMEISAEHDSPAQADIAGLASAYSVEFRGTKEGPGLWRAHVRALISQKEFDAVFEELKAHSSGDPEIDAAMRTEAATALIRHAEDIAFMRIALAPDPDYPLGRARSTLLAAGERMVSLGLPDAAAHLTRGFADDRSDRSARLLNARILLAQMQPEDAEIALIGLQGPEVLALRAQARAMMGDDDYARSVAAADGGGTDAAPAAWRAGDWSGGGEDLAPAPRPTAVSEAASPPSLSQSEALVGASATTRESLRALLEATRISPETRAPPDS